MAAALVAAGGDDTMSTLISVCGLIVIPGREEQGWETGLYVEEVAELDLSAALEFTRHRIREEGFGNAHSDASFIAAAFHPGVADRCAGLDYADMPVNIQEEYEHTAGSLWAPDDYTVCGFYSDTWQTYSGVHQEVSPRMAYLAAWWEAEKEGHYLYVANVHKGVIPRLPMLGTSNPPEFGDPGCRTATEMAEVIASAIEQ